ncbi:MAG: SH3-like domain-containing protein [Saprospiraceae bacterium]|nr:SH3-like domain-containing protein [Saprospiraceae bacterium]
MSNKIIVFLTVFTIFLQACESKPKVIVADKNTGTVPTESPASLPITGMEKNTPGPASDVHQVLANEVLQTERYTYLNVTEADKAFWIATAKTDAKKGLTYLYRGGLMKTNFESIEFKRTFDTIYLVSNIISATAHPGGNISGDQTHNLSQPATTSSEMPVVKNAVKLSDLFTNKTKYDGQIITVSGECIKVNNGIMGRNWVHIQDGSKLKGKAIDLTVTTNMNIEIGSKLALKGKITLNKDFGAGYKYEIIMEEASGI